MVMLVESTILVITTHKSATTNLLFLETTPQQPQHVYLKLLLSNIPQRNLDFSTSQTR